MQNQIQNDMLTLDGRKKLSMTAVESVNSFSQTSLKLTVSGKTVLILGENIKIDSYNKATGSFNATGIFNEIKYSYKKQPLIKKIFK